MPSSPVMRMKPPGIRSPCTAILRPSAIEYNENILFLPPEVRQCCFSSFPGRPKIFNTDQGSQFTSDDFTGVLRRHEVTISMDGKGRCMEQCMTDSVCIRLY